MTLLNNIYSHPNKLLVEHLKEVGEKSKEEILKKKLDLKEVGQKELSEIAYLIGISHDFGKSTSFFQKYLKTKERNKYTDHSLLSSIVGYKLVKEYCKKNRINLIFANISFLIIKKHHGNLEDLKKAFKTIIKTETRLTLKKQVTKIPTKNINKIYSYLLRKPSSEINLISLFDFLETRKTTKDKIKEMEYIYEQYLMNKKIDKFEIFFISNFLYSLLIDFDKKSAANLLNLKEKTTNFENFVDKQIKDNKKLGVFKNNKINKIRERFYLEVTKSNFGKEKIYLITAPTGIGKTYAAYSFAFKLKEKLKDIEPKIIYALPFTTIIDQNFSELEKILKNNIAGFEESYSDYLLKHHYLSENEIKKEEYTPTSYFDDLLLIESWNSQIIVSTFYQLFYGILGFKNKELKKFHNIVNSIIILDEIQNISPRYWKVIEKCFYILSERFNCYFITMSATHPKIFPNAKNLIKKPEKYYDLEELNRVNLKIIKKNFLISKLIEFFKKNFDFKKNKYLLVLNTRKSAIQAYKEIKKIKINNYKLICLTNNIIPKHRKEKIELIKKTNKAIIISTQLIEAGVDIDVDVIYRDFAPLDSIVQTAGRCNRNSLKRKGKMFVVTLRDENKEYCKYIYEPYYLEETKSILKKEEYNSIEFHKVTEEFFKKCKLNYPESENILEGVKKLNYDEGKESVSTFKLIENIPIFEDLIIPIDETCKKLIKEYDKLTKKNKYKKDISTISKIKKIKRKLGKYIISIPKKDVQKIETKIVPTNSTKGIKYVSFEQVNDVYNKEVGFKINENNIF